jgi:hypothetical protein
MRFQDEDEGAREPNNTTIELKLESDGVEFLDFSPEFVEAFTSREMAFFAEGDEAQL